jgi:hypothetical protein
VNDAELALFVETAAAALGDPAVETFDRRAEIAATFCGRLKAAGATEAQVERVTRALIDRFSFQAGSSVQAAAASIRSISRGFGFDATIGMQPDGQRFVNLTPRRMH